MSAAQEFTQVETFRGKDFIFTASSQAELRQMVANAYAVVKTDLEARFKSGEISASDYIDQSGALTAADAKTELELKFKRGEISASDFIELSSPEVFRRTVVKRRRNVSPRLRFLVFLRDGFTCQYCGRKPPDVKLQADHVHPWSKGGKDRMEDLITACRDCNLGRAH